VQLKAIGAFECSLEMHKVMVGLVEANFDNIESAGCIEQSVAFCVVKRRLADFALLRLVDGFGWPTRIGAMFSPSFDFDEDYCVIFPGCDDIDFSEWTVVGVLEDDVATTSKEQQCQAFAVGAYRFIDSLFWVWPGTPPIPPKGFDAHAYGMDLSQEVAATKTPLAMGTG